MSTSKDTKKPTYEIKHNNVVIYKQTLPASLPTSKQTIISLPVTNTTPNTYTSISNTPKPILTTNGTITKAPAPPVQIKVEVESDDAKQNQWTHEETMILINAYKKHQPTTSDDLKAIELWKIIARNLSGKLTKSPQKMYSKWRNLVRTYKAVIKSNRTNIKFAFYNDMKQALQHRPTEDLFKKDKKHTIVPTTAHQPPVKRARSIPLSTSVEENIEENDDLLTDDPMLEQEQHQLQQEREQQEQQQLEVEQHQQQQQQEAEQQQQQQLEQQQQQSQVTTEKCLYTIIDKSELNDDILLKLKLKSPTTTTESNVSQQSKPCVFAIINKPQTMNQSTEQQQQQQQQQQHQHTTLHELIQSTTAPEPPVATTSYTTHSTIIKHEPQQQVVHHQPLHQQIKYVLHECDGTLEEQEYQSHMQNSATSTVTHIVEDEMIEDNDQEEEEEEEDEIDERTKEELKESLRQHLQLSDEGRLISYKNRIQMLQEEYYREKINFIRMQNERETEQLEIQKRRLQIEERRADVVEALLEKILKD